MDKPNTGTLGFAFEPVEHGSAVKISFVDQIVVARQNVIQLIERICSGDFIAAKVLGACAKRRLYLLVAQKSLREFGCIGEIHVAKALQRKMRDLWIVAHEFAKILDELSAELRDLYVDRGTELLPDAAVCMTRRCKLICWVTFDHQNRSVKP